MKIRTFHNRVERNEFTFDRSDVLRALKAEVVRIGFGAKPAKAATEHWDFDIESDDGEPLRITVTQDFEYLSEAVAPATIVTEATDVGAAKG